MVKAGTGHARKSVFRRQLALQGFVLLGVLYLFVFNVAPMVGIVMSFKDYKITMGVSGIFTSPWVGLKHFREFVTDFKFNQLLRNTLSLSVLKLIFCFPAPILFAIVLNEIRSAPFKRIVQTASYLPNFISWVIVAGLLQTFFSSDTGAVSNLLAAWGVPRSSLAILTNPGTFRAVAVLSAVWKEMGWWAILFLAAIAGIDPALYESAQIDGASKLQQIWHITLSSIMPTISVVLVIALGNLLGGGIGGSNFDQCYLLGNSLNRETSEIIQTYTFEIGLSQGRYAYATAVGLFQSAISVLLVAVSNMASRRISGSGLF